MKASRYESSDQDKRQPRSKPSSVRRRSGRQGPPSDRHGVVFEGSNDSASTTTHPSHSGGPVTSPPQRASRKDNAGTSKDQSGSVSNTDEENTIESRRRRAQVRASTTDEIASDASPGSFMTKNRRRLNSITTTGNLLARPEEQLGSIGFPSVIHVPQPQESLEDRLPPRTPRHTYTPDSVSTFTSGGIRSPTYLDTDSAKILHLMKTTCGRMHGILFFQQLRTNIWASGYCSVQVATGSLICQVKGETAQTKTLISDLRGCSVRTHYDLETQSSYLSVQVASNGTGFQLRPSVPETFDSWLAALLCWQPLRPRGIHNKLAKPQPAATTDRRPSAQKRISDLGAQKSKAIIKVGKLLLWDGPLPSGSQASAYQQASKLHVATNEWFLWRRVSCNLHENGSFKLFSEGDNQPLSSIALSQLARCAVQRFDRSILDMPYCVAIYPQYTIQASNMRQKRPMVLCFETRVAFEAWFVLLRALTVPEWYGPEQSLPGSSRQEQDLTRIKSREMKDMFRIERQLTLKIIEGKFVHSFGDKEVHEASRPKQKSSKPHGGSADIYADVICGQDLRARTTVKSSGSSVFWADEFTLMDLPSSLNRVAVIVRAGNPGEQEWTMIAHGPYDMSAGEAGLLSGLGGIEISSHDSVIGKIEVQIDELEREGNIEKWMPIVDSTDRVAGQILMKLALQESVVLMSKDYTELSTLLHNWSNSLTTQMAHALGPDLKPLSDVLLDYYQSIGDARDWLCNLIEEEIDGIYRETLQMRIRFSGRLQSNDSYESAEQREQLVRDLSRSATMEANLLFRGNSLITRALDAHMRRLGRDYLEATLGARLRKICERDFDCEVDPGKVKSSEHLERNWNSLLQLTNSIWKAIVASAEDCPTELRVLFRHIRSCAEDRYGSFIRTVKYTSVSGFLFLRFFCPAILNPKLFGLLPEHPPDRTKRSLTLIAKSLITLANLAKFGTKETWMEPMNRFLTSAAPEFRDFVNEICSINTQILTVTLEPQYGAPAQIKSRLPPLSREGLPSLPFLLDPTKLLADLVELWATRAPKVSSDTGSEQAVRSFDTLCRGLYQRSQDCLSSAEPAEKPDVKMESKWQQALKEQQKTRDVFNHQFKTPINAEPDLTALPQPVDALNTEQQPDAIGESDTTPSSAASGVGWDRRIPFQRTGETRARTSSTNSSTASLEIEENRQRPPLGSRDGKKNGRLFDLIGSSGRRKGKGESAYVHDDSNDV